MNTKFRLPTIRRKNQKQKKRMKKMGKVDILCIFD